MKRQHMGTLGALLIGGTVLSGLLMAAPAQADFFRDMRRNHSSSRSRDYDRDGIPNRWDRDPYSNRRTDTFRYYRDGRYYSTPRRGPNGDLDRDGVRNKWDRDRDGDGRRNKRDDHPSDRRRR